MMKFFQDNQPPRVWNPAQNKVAVTFQNKVFETEDPAIADLLIKAGYRYNGSIPVKEEAKSSPEDKPDKPKTSMVRKKKGIE